VTADASRPRRLLVRDDRTERSPDSALPPSPGDAFSYAYRTDLSRVRAVVLKHAREAGLLEARASDLVLAVSELAGNTLRHTRSGGTLTVWRVPGELVCEIHDQGTITDPLAGRRRPAPGTLGGQGLWLVHQVCDQVELHSGEGGTTVRAHMTLG
jgi:anti-sigma regulatory factor (Ser/Thr protein kinase)